MRGEQEKGQRCHVVRVEQLLERRLVAANPAKRQMREKTALRKGRAKGPCLLAEVLEVVDDVAGEAVGGPIRGHLVGLLEGCLPRRQRGCLKGRLLKEGLL